MTCVTLARDAECNPRPHRPKPTLNHRSKGRVVTRVCLVAGDGLVGRTNNVLWWTNDDRVIEQLTSLDGTGFTALADVIVNHDFAIDALTAFDVATGVAFVCGHAQLSSGGVTLDGTTTATWIEQPVTDPANVAVNATTATVDHRTNFIDGIVPGGGFVVGSPTLPEVAKELKVAEEPEVAEAPAATPTTQAAPTTQFPQPAAPVPVAPESPPPAETLVFDDPQEIAAEPTNVAPTGVPVVAAVEFDDGRNIDVHRGLIVGRNPEHGELPIGYTTATVLGEFISRRHWKLDLDPLNPVVQDLGSTSGTIVEFADAQHRLNPNESVPVQRTFRVIFADHWADVTVRPK